ncbi:MAG: hypothetical protein GY838_13230 [bacterium]|nr:hypothetical protein [bacterium]
MAMALTVAELCRLIHDYYTFDTETELQIGISRRLQAAGVHHRREVQLTPTDRIDFMIGKLGAEVKTKGSRSALLRQLHRYAKSEEVEALLLITTSPPLARIPDEIAGVPVHSLVLTACLI